MSEIPIETNFSGGLIAIAILLLLNGVLAMAETALLSVRKTRLQNQHNKGDERAGIVLKLTENPNQFLSVIQIGITSIDLLIGALTAATLGVWINAELDNFPVLQNTAKSSVSGQHFPNYLSFAGTRRTCPQTIGTTRP